MPRKNVIDTQQFWKLLVASQLVSPQQCEQLAHQFRSAGPSHDDRADAGKVETVANWLVEQKVLSEFQSDVLLKGASGPFIFGNYTVVGRISAGPLCGHFRAIHRPSRHPVLIQFMPGTQAADLAAWERIERVVEQVADRIRPGLVPVHETVVLPHYRFVVSQDPVHPSLFERIPRKSRLPWADACKLAASIALGLRELHASGVVHGALSTRTIHWKKQARLQIRMVFLPDPEFEPAKNQTAESRLDYLAPERLAADLADGQGSPVPPGESPGYVGVSGGDASPAGDVYALGAVLYRLVAGRVPFRDRSVEEKRTAIMESPPARLARYSVPEPLDEMVVSMLSKQPADRPPLDHVIEEFERHVPGSTTQLPPSAPAPPTLELYRESLRSFLPPATEEISVEAPQIDDLETVQRPARRSEVAIGPVRRPGWLMPVAVGTAVLAFMLALGAFAWYANQQTFRATTADTRNPKPDSGDPTDSTGRDDENVAEGANSVDPNVIAADDGRWVQHLFDDDGQLLWESPTMGAPVDFAWLPTGPKLILVVRPADLLADRQGALLRDALGPEWNSAINGWTTRIGLQLDEIEQLVISLHSVDRVYHPVFRVRLVDPLPRQRLLQLWNSPAASTLETGAAIYVDPVGQAAFFPSGDAAPAGESVFVLGPESLVREVVELAGASPLAGALSQLADTTDRKRHVNLMWQRNALFNDEGQRLMAGRWARFNRELDLALHDDIRGVLLSLHQDRGTYLEFRFQTTLDLKPIEFKHWLDGALRKQRDRLMELAASLPANPYWDRIRARFGGMVTDWVRQTRIGIDRGEVVANAWLPPMAAHNLVASFELLLSYADSSPSPTAVAQPAPSPPLTIDTLLQRPRDLNVTTNPDLNILLADLQNEILDEYGKLPFPFEIKILGNDLLVEGITKNQRPGEFDLKQVPLSQILTQIMVRCNPKKDISGPADPECKLIWVVGPDPDQPDRQIVLITTRGAAMERGYTLPKVFQSEAQAAD